MSARVVRFRQPRRTALRTALMCALLILTPTAVYLAKGGLTTEADAAPRPEEVVAAGAPARWADIRVTDGDTFRVLDERIRIANIDTPEMPGRARCADEGELALQAKARLGELLSGGEIRIAREGLDRYGRTLATVSVSGVHVGEQLIREGAAQRWMGRKAQWC